MSGHSIRETFARMDGAKIPGGCDECDAYQSMSVDTDGICHLTVHHDDWCPWWTTHRGAS